MSLLLRPSSVNVWCHASNKLQTRCHRTHLSLSPPARDSTPLLNMEIDIISENEVNRSVVNKQYQREHLHKFHPTALG
jgi:hypothetical protein